MYGNFAAVNKIHTVTGISFIENGYTGINIIFTTDRSYFYEVRFFANEKISEFLSSNYFFYNQHIAFSLFQVKIYSLVSCIN